MLENLHKMEKNNETVLAMMIQIAQLYCRVTRRRQHISYINTYLHIKIYKNYLLVTLQIIPLDILY